ncbi:copper homeostasis membrane protein CopD [Labrys monachus]|uniref:Copper resistance protein D n=1 Tax=Labrys monachus TaxID=217067 RepID=A0ABU0FDN0_9HYPH|nr:copper homeostasis membrane protein CopD [Labrys monachus]MDQ0392704.1 putative copper resistance protein D [Labrys monachus]
MIGPDAALDICRFLHDASLMLVWGASAYLAVLVPRRLADDVARRLRIPAIVAVAAALATTLAALPIETATIGEGWSAATDLATLHDVLFDTTVGRAWQAQAAGAALLFAAVFFPLRIRRKAVALASGLLLAGVALTGHAVMQDGWLRIAHVANDGVHVLSAGAWLGAMVPLLPILARLDTAARPEAGLALRRFSNAGHVAVALAIASGLVNTCLVLGRLPTDWSSPYQALLAAKIAAVAAMTGLALVNRYGLVPRMARRGSGSVRLIRFATLAEIVLGLGAVAAVSVLGMLEPV